MVDHTIEHESDDHKVITTENLAHEALGSRGSGPLCPAGNPAI